MADLPDLNVKITADTASLDAALKKAQNSAKGFEDSFKGASGAADNLGKSSQSTETKLSGFNSTATKATSNITALSAAATAAGAALVAVAVNAASAAKEIAVLSRQSGTSVENFQALAFAARSVGVEQDKLGDIFKDSRDKVGDFLATGGGELKDFFETVAPLAGVTAQEFKNLSGPQVLEKFQKALDDANVSANEQVFFLESLADEASRLQPLLTNNAAALNELTKEANELGLVLSTVEVLRLKEIDREISKIGQSMQVAASRAVSEFGPAFEVVGSAASGFAQNIKLVTVAAEALAIVIGAKLVSAMVTSTAVTGALTAAKATYTAATAGASFTTNAFGQVVSVTTGRMVAATAATRALSGAMAFLGGPVGIAVIAAGALFAFRDELDGTATKARETKLAVDGLTTAFGSMTKAQLAAEKTKVSLQIAETESAIAQLNVQMETLEKRKSIQDVMNQGRPGAASVEVRSLKGDIDELTMSLDAQRGALERINQISPFAPSDAPEGGGAFANLQAGADKDKDTSEEDAIRILEEQMGERRRIMEEFDLFEAERAIEKFEADKERLEAAALFDAEIAENKHLLLQELEEKHIGRMNEIYNRDARNKEKAEKAMAQESKRQRMEAFNTAVGLLNSLAQNSDKAAKAALVLEKARGIANTIINTKAAAMKAYAELGPIAGPPVAAGIVAMGALSVAQIASTGLGGAANITASGSASVPQASSGGGGVGGGASGGGQSSPVAQSESAIVNINLEGEVFGREQVRALIGSINEALDDGARLRVR